MLKISKHNNKKPVQFTELRSMTIFNAMSVFFENTAIWLFAVHRNLYAGLSRIWASLFFSKFFCLFDEKGGSVRPFYFFKKTQKQHRKRSNIYLILKPAITVTVLLIYLLVRVVENT